MHAKAKRSGYCRTTNYSGSSTALLGPHTLRYGIVTREGLYNDGKKGDSGGGTGLHRRERQRRIQRCQPIPAPFDVT